MEELISLPHLGATSKFLKRASVQGDGFTLCIMGKTTFSCLSVCPVCDGFHCGETAYQEIQSL